MSRRMLVANQPAVGKLIRDLRQELGMTQEKFAARLGVTCPTINRWENGRSKPSPLALQKVEEMVQCLGDRGQELLAKHFFYSREGRSIRCLLKELLFSCNLSR